MRILIILTVSAALFLIASFALSFADPLGESASGALDKAVAGRWLAEIGDSRIEMTFDGANHYTLGGAQDRYSVEGGTLRLWRDEVSSAYSVDLSADILTLSGGGLAQPLRFARQADVANLGRQLRGIFRMSPGAAVLKLRRIAVIILILVASRVLIFALHHVSRFVIYTDWGPLALVYRARKNRKATLHSIFLNLVKYVVYFAALGFILSELGVNYTAYVASLSVIGLAIGFGSQGLVQDLVTGIFIVFEGQFDVGDMVEISGQTGRVEELGLRMTRLRNYLGQTVIIPNRNIAQVGSYGGSLLEAYVDVAIESAEAAAACISGLDTLVREASRQFEDILARVSEPQTVLLQTGEIFVRIRLRIWPQQQWVVEQQVIPRIKEHLERNRVAIPANRVTAVYHTPDFERRQVRRTPRQRAKPGGS